MTAPPRLSPERLARLLDDAVGQVTAVPGTLERIHRGIRRRRWLRRSGAALLSAALLAGGGVAVLTVAPGGGPAPRRLPHRPGLRCSRRPEGWLSPRRRAARRGWP